MRIGRLSQLGLLICLLMNWEWSNAQSPATQVGAEEPPPIAWRDNAALHDVFFLDRELGWAVGDQGTILRTEDGGQTWTLVRINQSCSLCSVHFVDAQNGWAAGGQWVPLVNRSHAVILRTRDGGRSWSPIVGTLLPALRELRMSNSRSGWAWGAPTRNFPSGIVRTEDGGVSWSDFSEPDHIRWQAVAALQQGHAVVSIDGQLGTFRDGQFRAARQAELHPGIRQLTFFNERCGWALGNGELLESNDGGESWQPFFLPPEIGKTSRITFATAAQAGGRQFLAGSPGDSIFFRDAENGHWRRAQTPIVFALHRLFFVDQNTGWAVGDAGNILVTHDAGTTWQVQRSGPKRIGLLVVCPTADSIPFEILARFCADRGIYTAVAIGQADSAFGEGRQRAIEACHRQGVSSVVEMAPGSGSAGADRLADLIRQMQPSALVVAGDSAVPMAPNRADSRPSDLIGAVIDAVAQAGKSKAEQGSADANDLEPWQTPLVMHIRRVPRRGEFGSTEFLPSLGRNLFDQQLISESLLFYPSMPGAGLELLAIGDSAPIATTALFEGFNEGPLAPPRRPEPPPRGHVGQIKLVVGKNATLQQMISQFDSSPASLKVWRQRMDRMIEEVSPEIAGSWLWQLSESYWRVNQLELAALSRAALLERCGEHAFACEARLWLASYFASQELSWCEFQQQRRYIEAPTTIDDRAVQPAGLRSAPETMQIDGVTHMVWTVETPEKGSATDPRADIQGQVPTAIPSDFSSFANQRLATARALFRSIRQRDAELMADPQWSFAEAHLQRQIDGLPAAESSLRKIPTKLVSAAQREAIAREIQLIAASAPDSFRSGGECPTVNDPPYLDGVLDDEVWRSLAEADQMIRLSLEATANVGGPREAAPRAATDRALGQTQVMVAHDDDYLYLAAICHRVEPEAPRGIATSPSRRQRDQLNDELDRLFFSLDLDRDCRTSYDFGVDALGSFGDQIGENRSWNPTWYLAHSRSDLNWIIEAAIPLDQLGPPPGKTMDTAWGLSIRRRLPDGSFECWSPGKSPSAPPIGVQPCTHRFAPFHGTMLFR